jgi:hypothetical protein
MTRCRRARRRVLVLLAALSAWPAIAGAQPGATTPTPSQPAQPYTQAIEAAKREIHLASDGSVTEIAFSDFDRPFLLAQWLCFAPDRTKTTSEQAQALQSALLDMLQRKNSRDPADAKFREEYQKCLGFLKAPETAPLKNREFWFVNKGTAPVAIEARYPEAGRSCIPPWTLAVGERLAVDVADFRSCRQPNRVDFVIRETANGAPTDRIVGGFAFTFDLPVQLPAAVDRTVKPDDLVVKPGRTCTTAHSFEVALDATGVASVRYRNPRWPLYLGPKTGGDEKAFQACSELRFVSRIVSRQFVVTFSGIPADARWALLAAPGVKVRCTGATCSASMVVGQASTARVPLAALRQAYVKEGTSKEPKLPQSEVISFSVSFFDDDREPANARGYFSLVQFHELVERKSDIPWSSAASIDFGSVPDLTEFDPKYVVPGVVESATVRPNDWRMQGAARLSVRPNLGSRVVGDLELRLKSGEYGGAEPTVAATRYRIEVFALHSFSFNAGRAAIASPSESIAISEAGDSVGMRFWRVQLNHLFRKQIRESVLDPVDPSVTQTDREHHTTIFQLTGLPIKLTTLDIYGTYGTRGRSRGAAPTAGRVERQYWTVGSELGYLVSRAVRWTTALYYSGARTTHDDAGANAPRDGDEGRGVALLTTVGWTRFDNAITGNKQAVDWTLQGRYGFGLAEKTDPAHPVRQESYTGESSAFAPDVLFLATLTPALAAKGAIAPGLGNKHYLGATVNIPNLQPVADLLRKTGLPAEEFGAFSANLRAHTYWLRQPVDTGRYLGYEIDGSLTLEAPRGVKSTITTALFKPGAALAGATLDPRHGPRAYIDQFQWAVIGSVTLAMP